MDIDSDGDSDILTGSWPGQLLLELLVRGLPVPVAALRDTGRRIDWDLFVDLMERAEDLFGGPESQE